MNTQEAFKVLREEIKARLREAINKEECFKLRLLSKNLYILGQIERNEFMYDVD